MKIDWNTYNSSSYRISTGLAIKLETSSSYKICKQEIFWITSEVGRILEENPKESSKGNSKENYGFNIREIPPYIGKKSIF